MADEGKDRPEQGEILSFLRWLAGLTQDALALLSRTDRSQISRYEQGESMQPATLQRILSALKARPRFVDFLSWWLRLIRTAHALEQAEKLPTREAGWQRETRSAVWDFVNRAVALARVELAILRSAPPPSQPSPPSDHDHLRVEQLWQRLKSCSEARQRLLIGGARSYQDWLLAVRICRESESAAADKPADALELADLALFVARHVPGTGSWRVRLEGYCLAFLASAQRALNDVPLAGATFSRALRSWHEGEDEAGLLSKARLLDLGASVRREQGLTTQALDLHAEALAVAKPEEVGHLLLNKACTLQDAGQHDQALHTLEEATQAIDGARQPRLYFGIRFNQAANLLRLGRAKEAASIVEEVRMLAEMLGNDLDLVKAVWLQANLDGGLGKRREALDGLEQVRCDFDERQLPYDYALASLDVALLYREEGRYGEIQALAQEILKIFQAQKVEREAVAAVILFQEAVEQERVTAGLVRRLQDFLSKARSNPKLRFRE
ncbi:MAG TPA: helix-turn-helix transcriptional regulator [Thermoanaerobaculia bacterium]|nr:helix-turn-helix transcriptional regulator [Thermoanaerobaculia bacterium]